MALLSVQSLSVAIGPVAPLDAVSFAVKKGEVHGLVGESGSGKSLTAMSVMGLSTLVFLAVRTGFQQQQTGYASAMSLVFFVLVLAVSLVQRYLTRDKELQR